MKYIIYLLVGLIAVTLLAPNVKFENIKAKETDSITPVSEVKADTVKETVKDAPKPETKVVAPEEEKPVDVVKENPKNCDTAKEWILPDGTCKAKATESIASSSVAKKTATTGDCSLVNNYSNWDKNVAYAVCMAESGGNSNAANYNDNHGKCVGSFGLMQLACIHNGASFDPATNIATANRLWSSSGWGIWGAYTSGKYLKYL